MNTKKNKSMYHSLLLLAFMVLIAGMLFSQEQQANVIEVVPHLYIIDSLPGSGNVAFLVTDDGVLVIDSGGSIQSGKIIIQKIKETTQKPIKYLILTHYHRDHTSGIPAFPEGIIIIAHQNVTTNILGFNKKKFDENTQRLSLEVEKESAELSQLKSVNNSDISVKEEKLRKDEAQLQEYKDTKFTIPTQTYEKEKTISFGGVTVQLIYPGGAHTNGNSLVYFPQLKVMHTGDLLFNGTLPYIDFDAGSNTRNWIDWMKKLYTWDLVKIIPGHGPVSDKEVFKRQEDYLTHLRAAVTTAIKEGLTLEKMQETIQLPQYREWKNYSRLLKMNIEMVYKEMTAK